MVSENAFLCDALLMGVFITFIYDILRILRRVIPHGVFLVSLEDIIFWIYCAMEVFLLMHHESNGTLRWFAVFGALTGMCVYKKLISPFLVKYVSLVLKKIIDIVVRFGKIVFWPVCIAKKATVTVSKGLFHKIKRGMCFMKKKLTFFLKVLKMNL